MFWIVVTAKTVNVKNFHATLSLLQYKYKHCILGCQVLFYVNTKNIIGLFDNYTVEGCVSQRIEVINSVSTPATTAFDFDVESVPSAISVDNANTVTCNFLKCSACTNQVDNTRIVKACGAGVHKEINSFLGLRCFEEFQKCFNNPITSSFRGHSNNINHVYLLCLLYKYSTKVP